MNSITRREDTAIVPRKPDSRRPLNDVSANPTRKRQLEHESSHETSSPRKGRLRHQQEVKYLKNTEADLERNPRRREPQQPSSQLSKSPSSSLSTSGLFVSEVNSTPSANLEGYIQCWLRDIPKPQCSSDTMAHSTSTTSSRKRRRFSNHNDLDIDATPRPQRTLKAPAIETGGVPASDSSKSRSTTSKRSASPVKRIADMQYFSNPVVMKAFDDPSMDLRSDLGGILRQIGRFSRGIKVISRQSQGDIEAMQENSFRFIEEESFGDTLLPSPSTMDVAHILFHARKCDTKGHSEASWNCFVHSSLLDMALCGTKYPVEFMNCSTSRIQPTDLIPTTTLGQATESKMVDFAIYLKETPELANGIQVIAARHPSITPSFNQTFDPPLRTTPITVSIETKKTGIEWEKAIIQISTWAAAQFTRLEQLLYDSGYSGQPLPFLPLFIVQGHDWSFLAATRQPGGLTTIWSKVIVGSTNSALGVYQIVATLRLLAQWSADVFRPWFGEYVLGLTITPTIEGERLSK